MGIECSSSVCMCEIYDFDGGGLALGRRTNISQHLVFLFKLVFPCLGENGKSALANEMFPLEIYLRVRILFDVISGKI